MPAKVFPAELKSLHAMLSFIHFCALEVNVPHSLLNKISLAAEEALINIIRYAYLEEEGKLTIICQACNDRPGMNIVIEDQGIFFNPLEVNHETQNTEKLGGHGIHLYKEIMDSVEYHRLPQGNRLTLIKYY